MAPAVRRILTCVIESPITSYVAQLDGALRGPRRVKTDLLTEARDSLVDAADAYVRGGLGRRQAERRAVGEFGHVAEIAPGYQVELGVAQARRTALLVGTIIAVQGWVAEYAWRSLPPHPAWRPVPGYALVAHLVDWAGGLAIALALLAALACGVGSRYVRAAALPRAVGAFGLTAFAFFTAAALFLTLAGPLPWTPLAGVLIVPWAALFWVAPMWMVVNARRCLAVARG
jgi:hypothetical protein